MRILALLATASFLVCSIGQTPFSSRAHLSSYFVVPQTRSFAPANSGVEVTSVSVKIQIADQMATTVMEVALTNRSGARLESEVVLPVAEGAVLRGFEFQGKGAEPTAKLLARDEARRLYDSIVAATRDPALLEFLGCNLIRSSVFPVEAHGAQKVRITYEQLLPREGDRVDFILPRTESIDYRVPWSIDAQVKSTAPIATLYSPSHNIEINRKSRTTMSARLCGDATTEPGSFRLSYLSQNSEMSASLLAYPDPKIRGGYFALLAAAPARPEGFAPMPREVILVLDRSGSMAGQKLEQARAAALQVLEGLNDGESFNIVIYSESVEQFSSGPVVKNAETMSAARKYLRDLRIRGGTNIHDALQEALGMQHTPGTLPLVLFLTDGLPTVGQTSEKAIRDLVAKGNPHKRRVFTFGVGVDVNTPLLDRVALETRATSAYVLPKEDVEVKVGQVFKRLEGPVLSAPVLSVKNANGGPALGRVRDLLPSRLPDLFESDQLVLFGQYVGNEPLNFELRGETGEKARVFRFHFELNQASTKNAFVPRLWASRQIAVLTDAIRDLGTETTAAANPASDPRAKELVDEVIRLSKEFGILSEYTAFFAGEGTDLAQQQFVFNETIKNFDQLGMKTRSGLNSVRQSINNEYKRGQATNNYRNRFYDEQMNAVEIGTIQQVNNGAFYKKGNRWIDSTLVDAAKIASPRIIEIGSSEFRRLVERLAAEDRQGVITLKGEILLRVGEENVLVR